MSRFRLSSLVFAFWAAVFFFLPGWANVFAGVGYIPSGHAEDWTRIIGLFSLGFSILLESAHRSSGSEVRRVVALGTFAFTMPCALLMTYWQIIPERRWFRLDILNVVLLYAMAFAMLVPSGLWPSRNPPGLAGGQ